MKKGALRILILMTALALSVSVSAAEASEEWYKTDVSGQLIQYGGYPDQSPCAVQAYPLQAEQQWDEAKAALLAGLRAMEPTIYIRPFCILGSGEEGIALVGKLYTEVVNEHPDLFYVSCSFAWEVDTSGYVVLIEADYSYTEEEVAAYNEKVNDILSAIEEDWSNFQKALYLHDYLATHAKYDMTLSHYDSYSLLINQIGVCQAYTLAYKDLLNRLDIENGTVSSGSLDHIWNLVQLDGKWYHVDVTFDDPTNPAMKSAPTAPDLLGLVQHTYFLRDDDSLQDSEDGHCADDWIVMPADASCDSTAYDEWHGRSVLSPFVPSDGNWYYLSTGTEIILSYGLYQTADPTYAGDQVCAMSSYWHDYMGQVFSSLWLWRDMLVYNTPTDIRSYDPKTGNTDILYTLDTSGSQIFGLALDGDRATCLLLTDLNTFEDWELRQIASLLPYKAADTGDYSICQKYGNLYLRQDAADGYLLAVARYDEGGRMVELHVTRLQNWVLSVQLKNDHSTLKIFMLGKDGVPRYAAQVPQVFTG